MSSYREGSVSEMLFVKACGLGCLLSNHIKAAQVVHACDSSDGEIEIGGVLGLSGLQSSRNQKALG